MNKLYKSNSGFSLIEALIVISIMGILVGLTRSGMTNWLPDYHLNSSVIDLKSTLQKARLESVKSNADVFLQFDKNTHVCRVFLDNTTDAANRGFLDAADTRIDNLSMPSGVEMTDFFGVADPVVNVTINSRGFSTLAGEIHLKNDRDIYKGVRLTLAGNSRIIRSTDGGLTWK